MAGLGRGLRLKQVLQKTDKKEDEETEGEERGAVGGIGRARGIIPTRGGGPQPRLGAGRGVNLTKSLMSKPAGIQPKHSVVEAINPVRTPSPDGARSLAASVHSLRISPKQDRPQRSMQPIQNKQIGNDGRRIQMAVNYVRVGFTQPDAGIYEYHVEFYPNIDSRNLRYKLLHTPSVAEVIGHVMQFTGMNMFLPKLLHADTVSLQAQLPTDDSTVTIKIIFIKKAPYDEMMPFFNTLLRRIMNTLKMVLIQRHYYDPTCRIEIPQHKLEVWPGFVTAIQEFDGGLMLNCDASHRILRTSTARDVLKEILESRDAANFKDIAIKRLGGCVVLTRYNNKPYRIDDIAFDKNPLSTFTMSNGNEVSFVDYFKNQWEVDIRDERQPLLIHRPRPKKGETESKMVCLIPELSFMTGLTDDIRSDFRAMRDIASHTRIKPAIRHQKLQEFVNHVNSHQEASKILSDWGLRLDNRSLDVAGRSITQEKIQFKHNAVDAQATADWSRDTTRSELFNPVRIDRIVLIFTQRDAEKADEFVKMMKGITGGMGFPFPDPKRMPIQNDNTVSYANVIRDAAKISGIQFIIIITPGSSQREDRYSAIKTLCCHEFGIPSQVIRSKTIEGNKMRSVCQKIAIQISCKAGGEPWAIHMPLKSAMFVGIDVYHDAMQRGKSVVGVVASLNQTITRWYTRVFFQKTHDEIVNSLQTAIVYALKKYHEVNGCLPSRIFIYRDGVSDGQVAAVKDYEVVQLDVAIENFVKTIDAEKPAVSVIIVQKRINTKMLMRRDGDFDNPPPGSILDHTVTKRIYNDFYLISQHVTQGTVTPTHYIVIHDENQMPPDRVQRLTYKMTHLYYNWFGTIRVPAPCQYAHKAAYLIGQNVRKMPSEQLSDKLYFL